HRQDRGVQDLAMSAQKGRDAVRPPQTHLETRSAAITRPKRRPRRIPPRRHRPKPPQARHADPNANADLSNLRRRAAHEHGRDRRSPPPQYFKTDFFNSLAPKQPFAVRMRLCADSYLRDLAVDQVSANGRIRRCAGATCEIACFGFWPTADVAQTRSGRRHGGRKGDVALRAPAAERRYADSRGRSASPGRAPTFA